MKRIAPNYYRDFACIKGACRNSCCVGWEIDIDGETLEYYQDIGGEIGQRLRENIVTGDECAHFRLGDHERCPFLNHEGLCDLILELGEDSLCQICADHPRFRNFYADREEIGLGLCCEAAARLILTQKVPFSLEILEDDGQDDVLSEDEAEILALRDELIWLIQNRNESVEARVHNMLAYAGVEIADLDYAHWKTFLMRLERLDERWADELERLNEPGHADCPETELPFERLMVYLLYRHINYDDDDLRGRIAYCALIWYLLRAAQANRCIDDLINLARLYSSEIEYSDENMAAIIDEIHRLYPQI